MKPILFLFMLMLAMSSYAQNGYLVLKKRGFTQERYYQGSNIAFYTADNYFIQGFFQYCRNDSVFVRLGETKLVLTAFGTKIDTVLYGFYKTHIKDIVRIPHNHITAKGFLNTLFKVAVLGACVVAGNNINAPQQTKNIIQYTSVVGINVLVANATLFKSKQPKGYPMGKKYRLVYISF